jgi:hypothetical protein
MSKSLPLIRKIQADAASTEGSVTSLLRMAKIAATKLNLPDALAWIDRELNGYMDLPVKDLPPYRKLSGIPKGYNPYHGWQPLVFPDAKTAEALSAAPIGMALGAIEQSISNREGGSFSFPYPPELKLQVQRSLSFPADVHIEINYAQLCNIVDQVRNLILDWSLELEKSRCAW